MGAASPQQGRKVNLCSGCDASWRAFPFRLEDKAISAVPEGHFRPGSHVLARWELCSLCLLPGRHTVEGERGWEQTCPVDRIRLSIAPCCAGGFSGALE